MTEQPPFPPPAPRDARRRWVEAHGAIAYTSWIRRVGASTIDRLLLAVLVIGGPLIAVAIGAATGEQ